MANTNKRTQRKSLYFVNTMNVSMSKLDTILKNNVCHELKVYQNQIAKKKKKNGNFCWNRKRGFMFLYFLTRKFTAGMNLKLFWVNQKV